MAAARAVLGAIDVNSAAPQPAGKSKAGKTIEQTYQKKSQLEHILLRPDSYSTYSPRAYHPFHAWLILFLEDDVIGVRSC